MEEVVKQEIEKWAQKETIYQIVIAVLVVLGIISMMTKHFKSIVEAWPSIRKVLKWIQGRWIRRAVFEQDVREGIAELKKGQEAIEDRLKKVEYETKDNSGGSLKDVTKRTEQKVDEFLNRLEFTELKLEAGYQLGNRMSAVLNRNAEVIEVNPVFLKFFGWDKNEILKAGYENMVHEDDRRELQVKLSRAITTASKFSEPEVRLFDSDGKAHKVRMTGYVHTDRKNEADYYFVTFEILNN